MALLSGPALAADPNNSDITTKVTTNLQTATANAGAASDITIETNGSVVVQSTTPIIQINSSNIVTNKGAISNANTQGATGIELDAGNSGAFDNIGSVDMTGSGQSKIGINIVQPTGSTATVFNGVPLPGAAIPVTTNTIIDLDAESTFSIAGDNSTGIAMNSAVTANGDILIGGTMTLTPTSTTNSTSGGNMTGVNLAGTLNGNFTVQSTGSINVFGPSAHGVILTGLLNGTFTNLGTIQALGTTTPSTTQSNPEAGSAVVIENSIMNGFYNGGPSATGSTVGRASIAESGDEAAINISIGAAPTGPLTIGVLTDPLSDPAATNSSFINRGAIGVTALSPNVGVQGISINGTQAFNVDFTGNFFNGGTITATATNTTAQLSATVVGGLVVGGYTNIPKLINSNESGSGTISATISGVEPSIAVGIDIQQNATLSEIDNSGTITATASTTDTTNTSLSAFAIRDETLGGTLTKIVNSGQIVAIASALDNGLQVASAIDLTDSAQNVTVTNTGGITGSIILGSGSDTITNIGTGPHSLATIAGNIDFGGGQDSLTIGDVAGTDPGTVTGQLQEALGGSVSITVNPGSTLTVGNDGTDTNNGPNLSVNVPVSHVEVESGATLGLTLAQVFNVNGPSISFAGPVINASSNSATIDIASGAAMNVAFGSFVGSTTASASSQFILLDASAGNLTIGSVSTLGNEIAGASVIPFLFTGSVCTYNVAGSTLPCTGTNPINSTDSALVLNLTPKSATDLGLTGYAAKMFPLANVALANDNPLGAAVITAGSGFDGTTATGKAQGDALYQKIYGQFAPDVTGSQRALVVALTDQATGAVGARQRALRMYAGQNGDATLWGQEFTERLNVGNQTAAGGFNDSGFGFALGMDGGAPASGRYGLAFTFYSGDTSEKDPRDTKTTSQWYMLTGYTDWRGRGFFFDSQLSVGYGSVDGQRFFDFGGVSRTADGKRSAELVSGGATAGVAMTAGGTVIMPQISIDGMAMREESYTETNNGQTTSNAVDGFDLAVKQEYNQSLRAFGGIDLRQDMNFGDFFLQPELRAGYRYDFLNAAQKLDAQFVCSTVSQSAGGCGDTAFSITGPDPAKGNVVLGGSIATTTGAWSIGLNYDYIRGLGNGGGHDSVTQDGTITLVGRI
jgi:hypothetical protein